MSKRRTPAQHIGIVVLLLTGATTLVFAALWSSAAVFLLINKTSPAPARPLSIVQYWGWYHGTVLDKKLKASIAMSFLGLCVIGPLGVYAATRPRRTVHGDARFARMDEVKEAGLLVGDETGPAILLGRFKGKFIGLTGQRFALLSAPTRSGKGVGIVIPNLLAWPDSAVVNDIKGELWDKTAGFRAACGQAVYRWAPFDPQARSCQYNPLAYLDPSSTRLVSDVLSIGYLFYPNNTRGSDTDKFFADNARNLFLGLVLYLIDTPERPRTIGELLRVATGDGRGAREHLGELIRLRQSGHRPLRDECVQALSRLLSAPENTMGSILSTFNSPLTIFADAVVDAATAGTTFDIRDLRRRPTTVYLEVPPDKIGSAHLLINLFFSQVCDLSAQVLPDQDPTLTRQVLLVLDEFPSLGRVNAISQSIAYLAGYGLRLLTITQSKAQIADLYGREQAENFVANHAVKVLYTPGTQDDAEEYSKRIGFYGEKAKSRGRSSGGGRSSSSTNISEQRRALMLPQELRLMRFRDQVVELEGMRPILAEKILYYEDEVLATRADRVPPDVPPLDLALSRARVQGRTRPLTADEVRTLPREHLAFDLTDLPPLNLNSNDSDIDRFVAAAFDRFLGANRAGPELSTAA